MPRRPREPESVADWFSGLRADYDAMRESRFVRRRTGINPTGSGADYHYRDESRYLRLMEYARDFDRNDVIAGPILDTVCTAWLRGGFVLDPDTGDDEVNALLLELWKEWSEDPDECDLGGQHTFRALEHLALRAMHCDGDIFAVLPDEAPQLEVIEAHRVRTPTASRRGTIIHGIEINEHRERLQYWITNDDVDPSKPTPKLLKEYTTIPARSKRTGERAVVQLYHPKRPTQTRGITGFAPIFHELGMFEDAQFATLVKQQLAACFALIRKQSGPTPLGGQTLGAQTTETFPNGYVRTLQGVGPGMDVLLRHGEEANLSSPNIPSNEFFPHVRLILQLLGINFGVPLVMLLLDARETNFSGWRGAVETAREGFRRGQDQMIARWHKPIYRWKVAQWVRGGKIQSAKVAGLGERLFRHRWQSPSWPYIDPTKDAQSDVTQNDSLMNSRRRLLAANGRDIDEIVKETIADNGFTIEQAWKEAERLNKKLQLHLTWQDVLWLPSPKAAPLPAAGGKEEPEKKSEPGSMAREDE